MDLPEFNFEVVVNLTNGQTSTCGAMSFKQARTVMESVKEFEGSKGVGVMNAEIWARTYKGRHQMEKDFAVMDIFGNIDHYSFKEKMKHQVVSN